MHFHILKLLSHHKRQIKAPMYMKVQMIWSNSINALLREKQCCCSKANLPVITCSSWMLLSYFTCNIIKMSKE